MGVVPALAVSAAIWLFSAWVFSFRTGAVLVGGFAAVAMFIVLVRSGSRKPVASRAPFIVPVGMPEPDMSEELVDLLRTTRVRADRFIAERGRPVPFVAWHDRAGEPHAKLVDAPRGAEPLTRARELARSLDASAPRVVLCVPGRGTVAGKSGACVLYEAAERGFRDRTVTLVQAYSPKRIVFGGQLVGKPEFAGEGEHTLRFAADAEA